MGRAHYSQLIAPICFWSLFYYAVLSVISILMGEERADWIYLIRLPDVLWLLVNGGSSSRYHGSVFSMWLWLFLTVPRVGLQYVIVALPHGTTGRSLVCNCGSSSRYPGSVFSIWLRFFLTVPRVGLQYVIVALPHGTTSRSSVCNCGSSSRYHGSVFSMWLWSVFSM